MKDTQSEVRNTELKDIKFEIALGNKQLERIADNLDSLVEMQSDIAQASSQNAAANNRIADALEKWNEATISNGNAWIAKAN